MSICIKNGDFEFVLTVGAISVFQSDGRCLMWTLKANGSLKATGRTHVPSFVKFTKLIEHNERSFILMLANDTKYGFYHITPVRVPSGIVHLLEKAMSAFNMLAEPVDDPESTTALTADLGNQLKTYHVPKDLYDSVEQSSSSHWHEQYSAVAYQKVRTYNNGSVIIHRDGRKMTLQLIEPSGPTMPHEVMAHENVLFPYVTDRDYMLVAIMGGVIKCCICQSLDTLAKAIEDPAIMTNWTKCIIEPPSLNGQPFSLMPSNLKTGFTQPWISARRSINLETALSCGLSVVDSMFREIEPCARRFPDISNHLTTRIGNVYVCRSSGAIFMSNHVIIIEARVTRISMNMFVIDGFGYPVDANVPLVDAIADYAYSTPDIGEQPLSPIEVVIQRLVYFKYGKLEVLTVFPGGVITWVTSVTDISDERQFEQAFPDHTVASNPCKSSYYLNGILSLFYYGSTLAVVYGDRIDIYLNLISILSVLNGDVQPSIVKPNYYVEFAGMYLAMRSRCTSKPPIFVYASGAVSYSMPHLVINVNEEIISHAPAHVSILDGTSGRAIEWLSERPCSHKSTIVPDTNIYRNTIEF